MTNKAKPKKAKGGLTGEEQKAYDKTTDLGNETVEEREAREKHERLEKERKEREEREEKKK